jgi:NAD(P)-dependent dehydrogenase (short-subunit alcohol dehydrogenase family)
MVDSQPSPSTNGSREFHGRVAVVTGGTSGIGFATASALLQAGASVAITGRNQTKGDSALAALSQLRPTGPKAMFHAADVTREDEVAALISTVVERFGALHIAVNSAANTEIGSDTGPKFADMSLETFEKVVRTCLTSVWICMKHELPAITHSGGGAIVNVSSVDALMGSPGTGSYAAAKSGVNVLSRAAAAEYASQGVRINVVSPGAIHTPMLAANLEAPTSQERAARLGRYTSNIAAGRLGEPAELAEAILWLLSDHSSYVVGHNLVVDGALLGTPLSR